MHYSYYCVTPGIALAVFLGILILSLLIAGFCNPLKFDQTRTKIFLICLAPLGIFVTFLFYYALVRIQIIDQRQNVVNMTSELRKNILTQVMDVLHDSHHQIPHFVASLFPLVPCHTTGKHMEEDPDTPENNLLKHQISYKLFHLLEGFIIAAPFIDVDLESFIIHFLQRFSSHQLYTQWQLCKLDFNAKTRQVAEMLFNTAMKMNNHDCDTFECAARCLSKDTTFIKLLCD